MGICLGKEKKSASNNSNPSKEPLRNGASQSSPQLDNKVANNNNNNNRGVGENKAGGNVEDKYDVGKELGRGGFSVVREGIEKSTGNKVAIKFIEKKFVDQDELQLLQREIDIMRRVHHNNVLRLFEIFDTPQQLSLVMELVNGGELFYKIVDKGSYSESDARDIVRQLVEGVDYLHSQGIAHRDLKPENLLCCEEGKGVTIKIADFGLSKRFDGDSMMATSCGTPDYAAPEVLRMEGAYGEGVDIWSVGVITYVILCGFPPFYGKDQRTLFNMILNADYDFPDPEWTNISEEAKDFINHLLVLDVSKRYTTKQCLDHPWLKGTGSASTVVMSKTTYMNDYTEKRKEKGWNK